MRTRRHPNERFFVLAGLSLASAICLALEVFRERHFDDLGLRFLLWNLTLAWIPLLLAIVVYDSYRRGVRLTLLLPAIALWLLFLPNAPYIVTDFVHLTPSSPAPLWFDGAVISGFAWTGLLLGFASLYLLHAVVRHRFGARAGWTAAVAALALTSGGVYLGRVLQWNSWDLLFRPGQRLAQITPHLGETALLLHASAMMVLLTGLLAVTYLAFYALVGLTVDPEGSVTR
jgi:uncharacterized membrane protein